MPKRTPLLSRQQKDLALSELHAAVEAASLFHRDDLSISTRTVYIGSADGDSEGACDARMAATLIKNLHVLESFADKPITVVMNNPGGDVYHGLAIYDAIRQSPCDVRVIVRGYAMSMGSVILQAADQRVMGPNAAQMIHYGTTAVSHHSKTVAKMVREEERVNAWMERMYLDRIQERCPAFTLAQLKVMLDHDTYLTSAESVSLGLCDEVG